MAKALVGYLRTEMRTRVIAREQALLNRLIGRARSDQLTGEEARAGIVALMELRSLLLDLDRETRKAQEAEETLMGSVPPGTGGSTPEEDS